MGQYASINEAIKLATGDFLVIISADDFFFDDQVFYKISAALVSNKKINLIYGKSLRVSEKGHPIASHEIIIKEPFAKWRFKYQFPLLHCSTFVRSSFLLNNNLYFDDLNFKYAADWDLFFRIAKKFDVAYLAKPLNKFRQHKTTIRSSTKNRDMYAEFFKLLLSQLNMGELDFSSRMRVRIRVMDLWIRYVAINPVQSLLNLNYHFILILKSDFLTLLFLPISFLAVCQSIFKKRLK
jgi:hypothetical protein